jgi:hypothetical protein
MFIRKKVSVATVKIVISARPIRFAIYLSISSTPCFSFAYGH